MRTSSTSLARGSTAQSALVRRLRFRPTVRTGVLGFLWLFGLFAVFLSPAPKTITPEMYQRYQEKLEIAQSAAMTVEKTFDAYLKAVAYTNEAKVWFWRFKSNARHEVRQRQIPERAAKREYQQAQTHHQSLLSDAKAELGIWTEAGVAEGRNLFWDSYSKGKLFAQRQTLFDAILSLLTSPSSDTLTKVVELLLITCCNFTTGMIVALFRFVLSLPGLIRSFQPTFLSGLLFFITCFVGGVSVIVSFLSLLYGGSMVFIMTLAQPRLTAIASGHHGNRMHLE